MRKFKGYVTILEEKTMMRFVEIIQEVEKVDSRIQKPHVHVGKRHFIELIRMLGLVIMTEQGPRPIEIIALVPDYIKST